MRHTAGSIIHYVQQELFNGKLPSETGYYVFTRKELADGANISTSTFDKRKDALLHYFTFHCELKQWANYDEYEGEMLYIDVSYEKGKFMFKRNPITFNPELSHLWALPPLNDYFVYDVFDEKHRRRCNGRGAKYDAIPWGWDADLWEQVIQDGNADRINAILINPPMDSVLVQQAEKANTLFDVVLLLEGYQPASLAQSLHFSMRNSLPELCEFLLAHGADPNELVFQRGYQKGYSPMSAIDGAWEKGENWEKVVRLAIDAGGDLTWNNYHLGSVAKAIFANGSVDLCKYFIDALARQGLLDAVFFEDQTPLAIAKAQRTTHPEVILYLEQMIEQYRIHET